MQKKKPECWICKVTFKKKKKKQNISEPVAHLAQDPSWFTGYCNVWSAEMKCHVFRSLVGCIAQTNENLNPLISQRGLETVISRTNESSFMFNVTITLGKNTNWRLSAQPKLLWPCAMNLIAFEMVASKTGNRSAMTYSQLLSSKPL